MYKDIITYELADNVSFKDLKEIAKKVSSEWMQNQKGFISWEINTDSNGGYTDIVSWESEEHAKAAEKEMVNVTSAADWFACYKEGTIKSKNITTALLF